MRVLLQGSHGLFFQDEGRWVKDPAEARCFKSGTEAIDFAASKNITGALVIYEFGGKMFDFTVPMKALEVTGDGQHVGDGPPMADRQ